MGQRQKERIGIKQETRHNNLRGAWGFSPSIEKENQDTGEEPGLQSCQASQPEKSQAYKAARQASQRRARLTKLPGRPARRRAKLTKLSQELGLQSSQARKATMQPSLQEEQSLHLIKPAMQAMPCLQSTQARAMPPWPGIQSYHAARPARRAKPTLKLAMQVMPGEKQSLAGWGEEEQDWQDWLNLA